MKVYYYETNETKNGYNVWCIEPNGLEYELCSVYTANFLNDEHCLIAVQTIANALNKV